MTKVSLIITCGYIQHEDQEKKDLENQRLKIFLNILNTMNRLEMQDGDEIVISEYGLQPKLFSLSDQYLHKNKYYVFTCGDGFNQSIAKNAGAKVAKGDILCWVNSDVILQKNIFDVVRKRFEKNPNIFLTCARHDVFLANLGYVIRDFSNLIDDEKYYIQYSTEIDDAGWHHALNIPKTPIKTSIKAFANVNWVNQIIHDFTRGYINYGELMSISKENWDKVKFDEEITAIVDSYYRDATFALIPNLKLELVHDETAIFHLSGQDFMQQEQEGTDKHKRLIDDLIKLAKKYEFCRHALVFSYRKSFDKTIAELNIPFKEIFDKWSTSFMKKYYHDKERAKELYGIVC